MLHQTTGSTSSLEFVRDFFRGQYISISEPQHYTQRPQLVAHIEGLKYLIEVNDWKNKLVSLTSIQTFYHFLTSENAKDYAGGIYLTYKGFSETAKFFIDANHKKDIVLGLMDKSMKTIHWQYPLNYPSKRQEQKSISLGIFACKGGVGKTTLSAHLAILFAELGYSVALIDEDPDRHLKRIVGNKIIISKNKNREIVCFSSEEAGSEDLSNYDFLIYDYPPSLHGVSVYSIGNLNYCLVPVNLSPLALGIEGEIIHKTFYCINQLNPQTKLLAIINNEMDKAHPVSKVLRQEFKNTLKQHAGAHLIPVSIRHSKHLYYWSKGNSFSGIGKSSTAYQDFLSLADYLIRIFR